MVWRRLTIYDTLRTPFKSIFIVINVGISIHCRLLDNSHNDDLKGDVKVLTIKSIFFLVYYKQLQENRLL